MNQFGPSFPFRAIVLICNYMSKPTQFTCCTCGIDFLSIHAERDVKYCSSKCYGVAKKGLSPWNKGTKDATKPNSTSFKIGPEHPRWKGVDAHYYVVPISKRVGPIALHRDIMEKYLGRKLDHSEHVHHIDGDKHNNDIANLVVLSASEHARLHALDRHAKRRAEQRLHPRDGCVAA